jgi:hypothetical protein
VGVVLGTLAGMSLYSDGVLSLQPLVYYRLDDSQPGVMTDTSGHGRNGSYSGGVILQQPSLLNSDADPAVSFDGTTGIGLGPHITTSDPNTFTLECWFRASTVAGAQALISLDSGEPVLRLNGNQLAALASYVANICNSGTTVIVPNTTYHGVWTKSAAINHLYLNGVDVTSNVTDAQFGAMSTTAVLTVGQEAHSSGGASYFAGVIDEVAVYDFALTAAQVASNYRNGKWFFGVVGMTGETLCKFGDSGYVKLMLQGGPLDGEQQIVLDIPRTPGSPITFNVPNNQTFAADGATLIDLGLQVTYTVAGQGPPPVIAAGDTWDTSWYLNFVPESYTPRPPPVTPPVTTTTIFDTGLTASAWAATGSGFVSTVAQGNPTPSYNVPNNVQATRNVGVLTTYSADVWVPTGYIADLYFGCNSAGVGYFARVDTRSGSQNGIGTTTGWGAAFSSFYGGPSASTPNTWHTIAVSVSATTLTLTVDGVFVYSIPIGPPLSPYIALASELGATYWDNIIVGVSVLPPQLSPAVWMGVTSTMIVNADDPRPGVWMLDTQADLDIDATTQAFDYATVGMGAVTTMIAEAQPGSGVSLSANAGMTVVPVTPSPSNYRAAVMASSPVLYWPLNDPANPGAASELIANNLGQFYGGVTFGVTDPWGQPGAVNFDGSTGEIVASNPYSQPTAWAIECLYRTSVTPPGGMVEHNSSAPGVAPSGTYTPTLYLLNGQILRGYSFGGTGQVATDTINTNDGNWHHAVFSFDGSLTLSLYRDGRLVNSATNGGSTGGSRYWRIAHTYFGGGYYSGDIAHVAIYSRALSASEIATHYSVA